MTAIRSTFVAALALLIGLAFVAVDTLEAQRGRGGGRGRRPPVAVMTLTIPAWTDGGMIPQAHAQDGGEQSPSISWSGAPEGTASFVLVVHDVDTPTGASDRLHWLVWNIPPGAVGLAAGLSQGPELADGTRQISATGAYYRGPAKAPNEPPHHYLFELYAVDSMINVPPAGASPADTRAAVMAAIENRVLGRATYVGRY